MQCALSLIDTLADSLENAICDTDAETKISPVRIVDTTAEKLCINSYCYVCPYFQ